MGTVNLVSTKLYNTFSTNLFFEYIYILLVFILFYLVGWDRISYQISGVYLYDFKGYKISGSKPRILGRIFGPAALISERKTLFFCRKQREFPFFSLLFNLILFLCVLFLVIATFSIYLSTL